MVENDQLKIGPPPESAYTIEIDAAKLLDGRSEVKRSRGQAIFVYSYLGKTWTKFIIDNSFASMHPCIFASNFSLTSCPPVFCSSDLTHPFTSPPLKGGEKEPSPHPSPTGEGAAHVAYSHNIRRAAFTLAEVLITLGIIGVVAAMTIPAVTAKYQQKVLQKQFLKSYNTIQNAYKTLEYNLGYAPECYYPDHAGNTSDGSRKCKAAAQELKKNMSIIKECNGNALNNGCIPEYKGNNEIFAENNPDATEEEIENSTKGCTCFTKSSISNSNMVWVLSDGTIMMWCYEGSYPMFAIDINGRKGPNKWGYDLFQFGISSSDGYNLKVDSGISCGANTVEKGGKTSKQMLLESYK